MSSHQRNDRSSKPRVLLTIPCLHWIHKLVVHRAIMFLQDPRYAVTLQMPSNKPFEANLHDCVNEFMAGDWAWWLSMDADNPPEKNPLDLIEHDKDIIGCPTPIYHCTGKPGERPIYWNAYRYVSDDDAYAEWQVRESLQRVDAIGTGCFLVNRRVFEHPEMRKGPFMRKWNEDGTVERGNDIAFCERARECGFQIWCHFDYPAEHMVEIPLNEVSKAFKALM